MSKLRKCWQWLLTLSLAAVCITVADSHVPGFTQTTPTQTVPNIAPRADQLLRQTSKALKAAPAFRFQADITIDTVRQTGQKLQYGTRTEVVVRRPNSLWAETNGDRRNLRLYYDGKTFAILNPSRKLYSTLVAPPTIDALVDRLANQYGLVFPLADLVYSDPYASLTSRIESGSYIGLHTVNGKKCHHLAFTQEVIDWQIWVEDRPQALPCKLLITYKTESDSPQYTAVFSNWQLGASAAEKQQFTFVRPPQATRIDFLPLPRLENSFSP